jgi:SAM-dependent methyltransferase
MSIADQQTIDVYAKEAATYALRDKPDRIGGFLEPFMADLPAGATVLDLGCGSGWAAALLEERGFDVTALDATPEFAALASAKLKRPVVVASFESVEDVAVYDGIWASASLLHVRKADLPGLLSRLTRALKPGGQLLATFKQGEGEERDKRGRFYSYYSLDELQRLVAAEPTLSWQPHLHSTGVDFNGVATVILGIRALRKA